MTDPSQSPVRRAIHELIQRLREHDLLAVESTFSIAEATEALLEVLGQAQSEDTSGAVNLVADALVDTPGVDELYADNETLEGLLRDAFVQLAEADGK